MPDQPAEKIANIMWQHDLRGMSAGRLNCTCGGWNSYDADDWRLHVAKVLVSELGITAEWALTSGGGRQKTMSERSAREKAKRWPEAFGVASRYVTRWVDQ